MMEHGVFSVHMGTADVRVAGKSTEKIESPRLWAPRIENASASGEFR